MKVLFSGKTLPSAKAPRDGRVTQEDERRLKGEVTNKTMYVGREIKFLKHSQEPR